MMVGETAGGAVPPTIKQVAKRAGVSTATVSRALSGSPVVSADLAKRVEEATAELGYNFNGIASALRRNQTDSIGVVVADMSSPGTADLIKHLDRRLAGRGDQMLFCDSQGDPRKEATRLESLVKRQVDGIIICPVNEAASGPAIRSTASRVPLVQVHCRAAGTETDWVGKDLISAQALLVRHLRCNGVSTAVYVASQSSSPASQRSFQHLGVEAEANGIALQSRAAVTEGDSFEAGRRVGEMIISSFNSTEAVICESDTLALGVLQSCRDAGVVVPDDLLVTGLGDIPFAKLSVPSLTTVAWPSADLASEAVRLLTKAIDGTRSATNEYMVKGNLIIRRSTGR